MTTENNYCDGCYSDAAENGRAVRQTELSKYPLCVLCESRTREGLLHYRPSNGSEFSCIESRCAVCRHNIDDRDNPQPGSLNPPYQCCSWGILDRFYIQMWGGYSNIANWFDPKDLTHEGRCLRFTHRNDPDGELRDPSPTPDPAQMTFSDLNVPIEASPVFTTKSL